MDNEQRLHVLSWNYMLFRSLDLNLRYRVLTYDHLLHVVGSRLKNRKLFTSAMLQDFCMDLAVAVDGVPHPFRDHDFRLPLSKRGFIAYHYTLISAHREQIGDENAIRQMAMNFAGVTRISPEESLAFCRHLYGVTESEHITLKAVS